MRVIVSSPQSTLDWESSLPGQPKGFLPQFVLVIHAERPVGADDAIRSDILDEKKVLFREEDVQEIGEGIAVQVREEVPSRLSHLTHEPAVCKYLVLKT